MPLKKTPATRREAVERKIKGVILWQQHASAPLLNADEILARYKEIAGLIIDAEEAEKNALIYEAEAFYDGSLSLQKSVDDLLMSFEKEILKEKLVETMADLRKAELLHDSAKALQILNECNVISEKLNRMNTSL